MINSIIEEDLADEIRESDAEIEKLEAENKRLKARVIEAEGVALKFRKRALHAEARAAGRIPVGET